MCMMEAEKILGTPFNATFNTNKMITFAGIYCSVLALKPLMVKWRWCVLLHMLSYVPMNVLFQHANVTVTAGVWTAVYANTVETWQQGRTARAACLVTMATPPMEGSVMVSAKVTEVNNFNFDEHQQTLSVLCRNILFCVCLWNKFI